MEAPTSCAPVPGSTSSKCARCIKNGKPYEPAVQAVRVPALRLLHHLKFGDKNARARTAAAEAAAAAARTASEVAARSQLMELTPRGRYQSLIRATLQTASTLELCTIDRGRSALREARSGAYHQMPGREARVVIRALRSSAPLHSPRPLPSFTPSRCDAAGPCHRRPVYLQPRTTIPADLHRRWILPTHHPMAGRNSGRSPMRMSGRRQ
ncbi:hypothetical protein AK830_g3101 [Neonectria ditissima]|uniref:Uncharacterized protein n=1 Tax=Neonectria ditissima TaxID=78410 RepID=A0A0P7B052_9HYPO|nr:hypothetical protein AK830_g3101 [Neonectria ditissima]